MTRPRTNPGPAAHPDHHLWRNGRIWWVAFTFHTHEGRKHRVRCSLGTDELRAARARRDEILERYASRPGWRLSLRYAAREPRGTQAVESAHTSSLVPIVA